MKVSASLERQEPAQVAQRLWRDRYSSARVVFCAGSVVRGDGYSLSDLDVVVLFDHIPAARRESFVFEGWPVEVFCHDLETLAYFADQDCERGRPSLVQMLTEAICVPGPTPFSDSIQDWARRRLANHPGPPSSTALAEDRYWITDVLNDLRDERPPAELRAIACQLYPLVCNFVLRSRGGWLGSGKTLPRLVEQADPVAHALIEHTFAVFFRTGERADLIAAVQRILEPFGGEMFDGFRSDAPAEWRLAGGPQLTRRDP